MSLFLFLIVVVSLASGSVAAADVSLRQSVVASAGLILAWGMLAKTVGLIALARVQSGTPAADAIRFLERQLEILRWIGLVATVLCLFVFNLAALGILSRRSYKCSVGGASLTHGYCR